jgi:hypothetical protein
MTKPLNLHNNNNGLRPFAEICFSQTDADTFNICSLDGIPIKENDVYDV